MSHTLGAAVPLVELVDLALVPLVAGLAIALMCSVLSVLVVVRRLGFIGQGISHSAFGGVGVAALLAAAGVIVPGGAAEFGVIAIFCTGAALGMTFVGQGRREDGRGAVSVDAAIGLFLVGSMAAGGLLVQGAQRVAQANGRAADMRSWESILFGSILVNGPMDAWLGWGVALAVLGAAWWWRRPLLFQTLDDQTAEAFGVPTAMVRGLVTVLLAVAVVTSMKLAGVVLATALLVLPGATALKLTDRLGPCLTIAVATGMVGVLSGITLSLLLDWQPGPCIVLVMTGEFALAWCAVMLRGRSMGPALSTP
ncbi:MAG: metal ABC transporter permease [Phycisphaerales bacterium]